MKRKEKIKYALSLVLITSIVAGVYMFANKMMFYPVMGIYQIITILSLCTFIYFHVRYKALKNQGIQEEKTKKFEKGVKISALLSFPFALTIIFDYIYLLLLKDSELFNKIFGFLL